MYKGLMGFGLYTLFGVYLANLFIEFVAIPEIVVQYNNLISFAAGFLLLVAGVNYLRLRSSRKIKSQ